MIHLLGHLNNDNDDDDDEDYQYLPEGFVAW